MLLPAKSVSDVGSVRRIFETLLGLLTQNALSMLLPSCHFLYHLLLHHASAPFKAQGTDADEVEHMQHHPESLRIVSSPPRGLILTDICTADPLLRLACRLPLLHSIFAINVRGFLVSIGLV